MTFKTEIKKAVEATTNYKVKKVWGREISTYGDDTRIMMIEVQLTNKKRGK